MTSILMKEKLETKYTETLKNQVKSLSLTRFQKVYYN